MPWTVIITRTAVKQLGKLPARERARLVAILSDMERNPQDGDIKQLTNYGVRYRRRVGVYRILFNINVDALWVEIVAVERRGDDTYRRR